MSTLSMEALASIKAPNAPLTKEPTVTTHTLAGDEIPETPLTNESSDHTRHLADVKIPDGSLPEDSTVPAQTSASVELPDKSLGEESTTHHQHPARIEAHETPFATEPTLSAHALAGDEFPASPSIKEPPASTQVPASVEVLDTPANKQPTLSTRILAGVEVPDTPLITKALDFCRHHIKDFAYNHCVRSWLWGSIIADKIPELQGRDRETHAVATILHDLGWDVTGELMSEDKRFEVDGANAAREFLRKEAGDWDEHRLQLVWDAIALHTTPSIACYKEREVVATSNGIITDFLGPDNAMGGFITWDHWNLVHLQFPRLGLKEGVRDVYCHLCKTKPETTYDNLAAQYGEKYVPGYTTVGHRVIDIIDCSNLGLYLLILFSLSVFAAIDPPSDHKVPVMGGLRGDLLNVTKCYCEDQTVNPPRYGYYYEILYFNYHAVVDQEPGTPWLLLPISCDSPEVNFTPKSTDSAKDLARTGWWVPNVGSQRNTIVVIMMTDGC